MIVFCVRILEMAYLKVIQWGRECFSLKHYIETFDLSENQK